MGNGKLDLIPSDSEKVPRLAWTAAVDQAEGLTVQMVGRQTLYGNCVCDLKKTANK